jgi:hypothetical protein
MSWDEIDYTLFKSKPKNVTAIHYITQKEADKLVEESYMKAIEDTSQIVQIEFDRWLDNKDEEYPNFDNIFDGLLKLREKRK